MITRFDVYVAYRKAKANHDNKGFRLPNDWNEYLTKKMKPQNREFLEKLTGYFNTTFSNIDIDKYMECGFQLWKTFSYHMFLRRNIIDLYKEQDKRRKRQIKIDMERIDTSMDFIKERVGDKKINGYNLLQVYCKIKEGAMRLIVSDYLKNDVDPLIFVYCIYYKYIKLTDIEREYCYNVVNRYRDLLEQMFQVENHIQEKENGETE